jgi:hypothetical protein
MSPTSPNAVLGKRAETAVRVPATQFRRLCRARTPRAPSVLVSNFAQEALAATAVAKPASSVRNSCILQSDQLAERTSPTRRKHVGSISMRISCGHTPKQCPPKFAYSPGKRADLRFQNWR